MTACILCPRRGRTTTLDAGHVCAPCAVRLGDDLDAIARLASLASTEPRTGRGTGRTAPASRPPIDLSGIDPALTAVTVPAGTTTVLAVIEDWCRLVREERQLAPYGPASLAAARTEAEAVGYAGTTTTLIAAVAFLRRHVGWLIAQPWIDDLATEVHACHRALRYLDADREPASTVVRCPSERPDDDPCGGRIQLDEHPRCPRCGRDWGRSQLVRAASASPEATDVWVDDAAASAATGIPERTIRRWAAAGNVRRSRGRYALADIARVAARRKSRPSA